MKTSPDGRIGVPCKVNLEICKVTSKGEEPLVLQSLWRLGECEKARACRDDLVRKMTEKSKVGQICGRLRDRLITLLAHLLRRCANKVMSPQGAF